MINFRNYFNLFILWIVQSLMALIWLSLIPTDTGTYSAYRILLIGSLIVLIVLFTFLAFRYHSTPANVFISSSRLYGYIYILALILFLFPPVVLIALIELGQSIGNIYTSYAERLAPLAVVISMTGFEWCVWHIAAKRTDFSSFRAILATTFKILLLIVVPVIVLILLTQWGISPIRDGSFGHPPTPLLEWQIGLAVLVGMIAVLMEPHWKAARQDVILFILVYLITCFAWLADPLVPSYFATPPRAPNFEPYPFSDPLVYAQYSQSALVGQGFLWPDIPSRPFYVTLLTWLYVFAGQDYYHIIAVQTLLLAFFPALLYQLGRELGSRPAGLMLALLAILRDITSNRAATFSLNYSYSKLLLSEIPTGIFLVIFTILIIRWIKLAKPPSFFLLMGCVLGIASLLRLQSVVLFAPMAMVTVIPMWKSRRLEWVTGILVMAIGFVLVFSPWLVRNYYATGGLVLDNPLTQTMTFARRWSGERGNIIIPSLPGETTQQYVSRMNGIAIDSFKREPERIINSVASHFFNSLISSLHTFPIRDRIESPSELLWPTHAFWLSDARSPVLSTFYIVLLTLGLAVAWTSQRWIGLLPVIFSLAYNAWTALFLSSGDRFLIPIDWTWHIYYVLGMLTLAKVALSGMRDINWTRVYIETQHADNAKTSHWRKTGITAVLVLFVGMSLPLTEFAFPKKYPDLTQKQLSSILGTVPLNGEIIVYGRAIYPRYYEAGDGEPETAKLGYEPNDDARLVFWLAGPQPGLVIFPLETAPVFFPHTVDVWIVGRIDGRALYARMIKLEANGQTVIYGK